MDQDGKAEPSRPEKWGAPAVQVCFEKLCIGSDDEGQRVSSAGRPAATAAQTAS